MGHNTYFPGKINVSDRYILCYFYHVIVFNFLVGSLHEDPGEDSGVLNPRSFHLNYKISLAHTNYFHSNFPPTLLSVLPSSLGGSNSKTSIMSHIVVFDACTQIKIGIPRHRNSFEVMIPLGKTVPLLVSVCGPVVGNFKTPR